MKAKKRKLLVAGILGAAAVVVGAPPASAGEGIGWTYSTDADPRGAKAKFVPDGDKVHVCDRDLDGRRARATISYDDHRIPGLNFQEAGVADDKTADGDCVHKSFSSIPEGSNVYLEVCRYNKSTGHRDCKASELGWA